MPAKLADADSSSQVRNHTSATTITDGGSNTNRRHGGGSGGGAAGGSGTTQPGSSPHKRQKINHYGGADSSTKQPSPPCGPKSLSAPRTPPNSGSNRQQPTSAMYTFASSKNSMVIDLTAESPSSGTSTPSTRGGGGPNGASRGVVSSNGVAGMPPSPGGQRSQATSNNVTPKRLAIKNLRPSSTQSDPQEYFKRSWARLDRALNQIFDRTERPALLEELYKSVENICRQGQSKLLFDKLHYRCREHVKGPALAGQLESALAHNNAHTDFLALVISAWQVWQQQMNMIKLVFLYLNQSYLVNSKDEPSLDDLRVSLFRTHVFSKLALKQPVLLGACALVGSDRNDEHEKFNRELFKQTIMMFHELRVYTDSFEPQLLSSSQSYFMDYSGHLVKELSLPAFVERVQRLFESEDSRCTHFDLDENTARDIRKQLEGFFIRDRVDFLTEPVSVGVLLDSDETTHLRLLFNLLERKSLSAKLRPAYEQFIESTGEAIVFDEEKEQDMIPRLLAFKRKLDSIWRDCFKKEVDLGIGMRESFRRFMNKTKKTKMTHGTDNEKTGEMIAKYVDALLRGGLKAVADDADGNEELDDDAKMSAQLDQVLELFRFLNGKAVFEAFYKKDLARRLLHKTSANDWAEKAMLQRLKAECGANFTSNLESMFRDVDTSRDENVGFKTRRKTLVSQGSLRTGLPDLEVNVLESSAWPSYANAPIVVPQEVEQTIQAFGDYYKQRFPSRRLEWKHTHAHCQLDARFDKKYVVIVSAMQAVVLLQFNNMASGGSSDAVSADADAGAADLSSKGAISFTNLQAATKLEERDLVRTLQSLACARYRVLRKSTKGPDVHSSDSFWVNDKFRTDKVRFKINQIQLKETKEENKETHERVAADREFETQAAIVRIMKAKQKITHTELITETITALAKRGKVQPEDIKKQIDKLIDKEYMERIDDNKYEYMA